MRGLYTWANKTDINFWQTQRRKPQKFNNLGCKVWKNVEKQIIRHEREKLLRTEIAGIRLGKKKKSHLKKNK